MRLYIVDTTLRDGEQTPGVAFSAVQKAEMAISLSDLGVDIIEIGIPAMGKDEIDAIQKIADQNIPSALLTWNRMLKKDIDASLLTGVKNVHLSIPASFIQIEKKLHKTPGEVLLQTFEVVDYAIGKGCSVSIGAEDASRADDKFLLKLYEVALSAGASRLRYADTLGVLDPFNVYKIVKKIKTNLCADIDFHGHNDFGLATANALAAFKGGAQYISCSINGLGERAGNTAMEEIVMALIYMTKCEVNIKTHGFVQISEMVEKYSKKCLSTNKPVVGKEVFSHESGIHIDGLLKDIRTYTHLDPALLGRDNQFVLGKHSGKAAREFFSQNNDSYFTEKRREVF
jgi:homocitrate synthase NifV